ncbi:hypothetical protein QKC54_gp0490 [Megavirus baoshan]|uniref:Ricin B lectin domain-containing protein n=1 Tax=Megavirus baoshan TaxID=2496520 RepID=A0A3Q8U7W1_9VIRU|nr:hypothetical protein QKC54_gp0490 [Megavirus baoshan]AZL89339.1 hypothetical protein Mb0582 [Megavirus baoshan]
MGNVNRIPINISTNDKCITVGDNIYNGLQLESQPCNNESNQTYDYDPITREIKYGDWCITSGNTVPELRDCGGDVNQKWILLNDKIVSNDNFCLSLDNMTPVLHDCNNSSDKFSYNVVNILSNDSARIIRNNLSIPVGSLPTCQISILKPNQVVFVNRLGNNIGFSTNTVINKNSPELQCIGDIKKIILGPISTLVVSYMDFDNTIRDINFRNGTLEHDLIYDLDTSFSSDFKKLISNVIDYHIINDYSVNIYNTQILSDIHIEPGRILISNYSNNPNNISAININYFNYPSTNINITSNETRDYILGPYSAALLGDQYLYNSGKLPLLYRGLKGVIVARGITNTMLAAPLNSGYAIFSTDCNFAGSKSMAIIGDYSIKISNNNNWIRNAVVPDSKYTNPLTQLGDNSIASVAIGPYTKIILFDQDNYTGNNKIIENNSSNQSTHNLCKDNYSRITSSIKISYSESYVGYGLEPYTGQQYIYQSFASICQPNLQYRTLENFENYTSNSNKWMSLLLIFLVIIIVIIVIFLLTNRK